MTFKLLGEDVNHNFMRNINKNKDLSNTTINHIEKC